MKIMHALFSFFHTIVSAISLLIIPSLCANCRCFLSERGILCGDCQLKIFPIVSKQIDITPSFSMTVFAISDYKDPLKKLILAKRWSDRLASRQIGHLLWHMTPLPSLDYDIITPIPLHWSRYASRGFNQAYEIARVIQKKRQVQLLHLLKRVKRTSFQFELAASSRGANVKDAFELCIADAEMYKNKHILLIDDLMTTGATAREAAKELLKLKPKKITVAVVCRVI